MPEARAFDPSVATVAFEASADDYAEIRVDGELTRAPGQMGGSVISGWNSGNRLVIGRNVKPGQKIQLAAFGINPNGNTIYKHKPEPNRGTLSVFRYPSGYSGADVAEYGQPGSNGLTLDPQGRVNHKRARQPSSCASRKRRIGQRAGRQIRRQAAQ
jgi:hypothetical protein